MFRRIVQRTAFQIPSSAVARSSYAFRGVSSVVQQIESSVEKLPLRSAALYKEKNLKWTASDFLGYVEAHANALIEHGFQTGDTIAVWLPDGADKHVIMAAAVKAGMKVVDVDLNLTEVQEIRDFLRAANAKAIYFSPRHQGTQYLKGLKKAIPEFFHYNDSHGQYFHSKHFPTLKFFINIDFDTEMGCLNLSELLLHHPPENYVRSVGSQLTDDSPAYVQVKKGAKGVEVGAVATHKQVLDVPAFWYVKKLVNNEHYECN